MPPSVRCFVNHTLLIALPPGVAAWLTLKAGFVDLEEFYRKEKRKSG
jgi:hypothetical protein